MNRKLISMSQKLSTSVTHSLFKAFNKMWNRVASIKTRMES